MEIRHVLLKFALSYSVSGSTERSATFLCWRGCSSDSVRVAAW